MSLLLSRGEEGDGSLPKIGRSIFTIRMRKHRTQNVRFEARSPAVAGQFNEHLYLSGLVAAGAPHNVLREYIEN